MYTGTQQTGERACQSVSEQDDRLSATIIPRRRHEPVAKVALEAAVVVQWRTVATLRVALSAAPRASVLQGAESSHKGRLYLGGRVGKGDCVTRRARAHESERLVWLRRRRHHRRGLDFRLVQGRPQWSEVGRNQEGEPPAGALCVSGKRRPVEEAEQLQLAVQRQIDQRGQGLQPRLALGRAHPATGFSTSGVVGRPQTELKARSLPKVW